MFDKGLYIWVTFRIYTWSTAGNKWFRMCTACLWISCKFMGWQKGSLLYTPHLRSSGRCTGFTMFLSTCLSLNLSVKLFHFLALIQKLTRECEFLHKCVPIGEFCLKIVSILLTRKIARSGMSNFTQMLALARGGIPVFFGYKGWRSRF